jgi:hypothetical protein
MIDKKDSSKKVEKYPDEVDQWIKKRVQFQIKKNNNFKK